MGREVYSAVLENPELKVVSILENKPEKVNNTLTTNNPREAFALADVIIDFSTREACVANALKAIEMGKNLVIGTTGMSESEINNIRKSASESNTSGVISANFSVGVNVFMQASKLLQEKLREYDVEVIEVHHKAKKDSPSGTTLKLLATLGRSKEDTPVHSLRIGDVIGDHSIIFAGNSERIELIHRATSRKCFAQGALVAAKWVAGKKDGILHNFNEVID